VATNTAAGARYGYLLVWVLVVANVMAEVVARGGAGPPARPVRLAY
jgi:Mn2+/Fe2+ NRAMP family transporter